jgi:hypothetical protein
MTASICIITWQRYYWKGSCTPGLLELLHNGSWMLAVGPVFGPLTWVTNFLFVRVLLINWLLAGDEYPSAQVRESRPRTRKLHSTHDSAGSWCWSESNTAFPVSFEDLSPKKHNSPTRQGLRGMCNSRLTSVFKEYSRYSHYSRVVWVAISRV